MPSKLNGVDRALKWADYTKKKGAAPDSGAADAAYTSAPVGYTGPTPVRVKGSDPAQFEMTDNFNATVSFGAKSWAAEWALKKAAPYPDDLLRHEQGHYDISALLLRDLFVEVMALKGQTFATAQELTDKVKALAGDTIAKGQAINDLYDAEVHPEQDKGLSNGPKQKEWNAIFTSARTSPRPGAPNGPDGAPLKMTLIDVLAQNSRTV